MPKYVIRSGDRDAFIAGLRELTDFLIVNPGVIVPRNPSFAVFVDAADASIRQEVANCVAAPLGVPADDLGEGYFGARRSFGPIAYSVVAIPPEDQQ
ncbi:MULTISPECIES: hypothetical protein [unclassified Streptomyces]|uniref:Uncharacterized protein n=1 Tax=Streptomyces sp. NBC_00060 TaxID=2975636 RepID=A0AAU2GWS9_9ACTN